MKELRLRIWEDLYDAKKAEEFLSLYLANKRKWKNGYSIIIASASILGPIATFFQDQYDILKYSPITACIIILFAQLIDKALPSLLIDDFTISKLSEYRIKYVQYYEKLDRLWSEFDTDRITEDEAFERFFELKEYNIQLQELDNSILINGNNNLYEKANNRADLYMNKHFEI
ncbi:hypothetical protein ACR777_20130 [Sphingobacterium spiritivorum]|uniref:hypothetical protein n=1 Tax=Sphingobacterium spiritivorum TaxID=258 RepID=UPI003DA322DB